MKILKFGKKIIKTDNYIHKCELCKTKFVYNIKKDTEINGIFDTRLIVKCPNCGEYDIIEGMFGIFDKNIIKKEIKPKIKYTRPNKPIKKVYE